MSAAASSAVIACDEGDRRDAAGEQLLDELAVGDALLGEDLVLDEQRALVDVDGDARRSRTSASARDRADELGERLRDERVRGRVERGVGVRDRERAHEFAGALELLGRGERRLDGDERRRLGRLGAISAGLASGPSFSGRYGVSVTCVSSLLGLFAMSVSGGDAPACGAPCSSCPSRTYAVGGPLQCASRPRACRSARARG